MSFYETRKARERSHWCVDLKCEKCGGFVCEIRQHTEDGQLCKNLRLDNFVRQPCQCPCHGTGRKFKANSNLHKDMLT